MKLRRKGNGIVVVSPERPDLAPAHAQWLLDSFGDWLLSPLRTRGGDQGREMFEQRYVHRMPISSIARVHGTSTQRVRIIVARSRGELLTAAGAHLVARDVRDLAQQLGVIYGARWRRAGTYGIKRASR